MSAAPEEADRALASYASSERPRTVPSEALHQRERPLSARTRELLRRAAVTGFRAVARHDPGGKEAAATRFQAPSPSPTPDRQVSVDLAELKGEAMNLQQCTWDRAQTAPWRRSASPSSGRTTPLPILLAQMESQLEMTESDMRNPASTSRTVHFLEEHREKVPEVPLALVGQHIDEPAQMRYLRASLGQALACPPQKKREPETAPPGGKAQRDSPKVRSHHPPRSPRSYQARAPSPLIHDDFQLHGLPAFKAETQEASQAGDHDTSRDPKRIQLPDVKARTPKQSPSQSPRASPRQTPKRRNRGHGCQSDTTETDQAAETWPGPLTKERRSNTLNSPVLSPYTSLEFSSSHADSHDTGYPNVFDGTWTHRDDPSRTHMISDGVVTSADGSVVDLKLRGDKLTRGGVQGETITGYMETSDCIVWDNDEVWLRQEEASDFPIRRLSSQPAQKTQRRTSFTSRRSTTERTSIKMPKELRYAVKRIPSRRSTSWASEGPEDPEIQRRLFEEKFEAFGEVQCSEEFGSKGNDAPVARAASPRYVIVHRCNPGAVNWQSWKQIEHQIPFPASAELYFQSFTDKFPGCMESNALANKAGGRTLAQTAAIESARRFAERAAQPRTARWR